MILWVTISALNLLANETIQFTRVFDKPEPPSSHTRGTKARIVCTDRAGLNAKPIVALITLPNGDEVIKTFWDNGIETAGSEDKNDLFFFPAKYERWINIYGNSIYYPGTKMYNTEQEAKVMRGTDAYVATVKIEWME